MNDENIGMNTLEALDKLQRALKEELNNFKCPKTFSAGLNSWIRDAYHHSSPYTSFCWTSALMIFLEILIVLLFHSYGNKSFGLKSMAAEIFFLILLLFTNIIIVGWDSLFRYTEMRAKAKMILQTIEECRKQCPWDTGQYPHLHTPQSPCISSQWTYRNNELVNLPCHLLVEGDVILLRPGHVAPGNCRSVDKQFETAVVLSGGKMFAPVDEHFSKGFSVPESRKPAKPAKFMMLETPYVRNFKLALQNSLNRPVTLFSKERNTVLFYYVERIVIPIVLVVTLCIRGLHAVYFSPQSSEWIEHLLLQSAMNILPLLPLVLPIYWIILNAYGNARLLAIVERTKQESKPDNIFEDVEEFIPPTIMKSISFKEVKPYFLALILQKDGYLWRSANLLHVLGSITALCCVDKKGILSWPNPTAEKVFFLKPSKSKSNSQDSSHVYTSCDDLDDSPRDYQGCKGDETEFKKSVKMSKGPDVKDHMYHPSSQVEVLDLTHNTNSPFGIQFDDPNWKSYIVNLKPLGLAILLNTCNPKAQEHYTQFSDHISCESLYNHAAVPVVNKRCLCELAKQIGFTDSVVDYYDLEQQLGVFRHVHPEVIQKGRLARSLNFPRLKMPFPNLSCAIVKDLHRGSHQLFSQGTANLVLDACNEYWDGEDISVLTESDRKRILDFYHRSSLTAHCMGYAYGPMTMTVNHSIPNTYIELPADGGHLYSSMKNVSNSGRSWEPQHAENNDKRTIHNRCLSSDSLLLPETAEDSPITENAMKACVEQIGNEIFIGMVTMQYQACPDFVQLIEQLDKACIRFVHFSKENELRSRVFSEKMGLESGWNCHISLLSEKTRQDDSTATSAGSSILCQRKLSAFHCGLLQPENGTRNSKIPPRSVSAPSVVNLDTTVVKFEDEVSTHSRSEFSMFPPNLFTEREERGSNASFSATDCDSHQVHDSISSAHDALFEEECHLSHSPSHITESTDQSAPVTFDMSNRAKLPKGTENIRPHIENIDNVPLQVSLFTDCTAEATREMVCIMQEYGEVVCCLGSSANCQNMPVFLQADVSIAIEPLYPQLCVQQPVFDILPSEQEQSIGPTGLSQILNSLPCALSFERENPISLYHLIMEARHFMCSMRNSFQFMLCCCLSLSLLQILAIVFFLPLPLSLAHLLWLNCVAIPLLSLSLMGNPVDTEVTTVATGKNLKVISKQTVVFFLACYCAKFCPSVIATLFSFACIVASICSQHSSGVSESCWIFMKIGKPSGDLVNRESWSISLTISQNVVSFFILLYFVLISVCFVRRSRLLWNGSPLANKYWVITAPLVICLQVLFITINISIHVSDTAQAMAFVKSIPFYVWLIGFLWPVILVPVDELAKRRENKFNVRQQKRARLEFCTKLGMNSPF